VRSASRRSTLPSSPSPAFARARDAAMHATMCTSQCATRHLSVQ
jgi:hypothetical protein